MNTHIDKREGKFPFLFALATAVVVLAAGVALGGIKEPSPHILFEKETKYYTMRIVDTKTSTADSVRIMFLDVDFHSVVFSNPSNGYPIYTWLAPAFSVLAPAAENIHIIGGGAYTLPQGFADVFPDAAVSVTEIDSEVEWAAKEYFGLDDERIQTIQKDARVHFAADAPTYDIVFGDAYNSFISVPWHLTTREFTEIVKDSLTPNGVYAVNIIGALKGEGSVFFQSILKTFSSVFSDYYLFAFGNDPTSMQNIVLVGVNGTDFLTADEFKQRLATEETTRPLAHFLVTDRADVSRGVVLTDDFAPLENLMIPAMKQYFRRHLTIFRKTIEGEKVW